LVLETTAQPIELLTYILKNLFFNCNKKAGDFSVRPLFNFFIIKGFIPQLFLH